MFARWKFQWSEHAERIALALIEDGDELPERYADPPALTVGESKYWRIFEILQLDRPIGFGIGYIPTAAIIAYTTKVLHETDAREIDRAIRFVHAIDLEFVALNKERGDDSKEAVKP